MPARESTVMETSSCFPTPAAITHDTLVCPTNNPVFEHAVLPTLIASGDVTAPKFEPSRVMVAPPSVGFEAGNRTFAMDGELKAKANAPELAPATLRVIPDGVPVPALTTQPNDV